MSDCCMLQPALHAGGRLVVVVSGVAGAFVGIGARAGGLGVVGCAAAALLDRRGLPQSFSIKRRVGRRM